MELTTLLKPETILLPLSAASRDEVLEKMTAALQASGSVTESGAFLEAVKNREANGTTGIGFGVAIPHGKSNGVAQPGLAFARFEQPVDWNSLDGKPVEMAFLIAVPEAQAGNEHLKILVALSRKLIHESFRNELASAQSPQEILTILKTL